jgi:hypothetical protein
MALESMLTPMVGIAVSLVAVMLVMAQGEVVRVETGGNDMGKTLGGGAAGRAAAVVGRTRKGARGKNVTPSRRKAQDRTLAPRK